ncbi:MAG: protein-L-isoaspartate O-methyltransferase [Sphingobium sp.]
MSEQNFSSMRAAMVESQLRTSDVDDPRVIAAMGSVPRENFVAPERRAMAYIDRAIPLGNGRALNPPLATGRLLKEAKIAQGDRVLLVGAATGYTAALLRAMGAVVTAVEAEDGPQGDMTGVTAVRGPLAHGAPDGAPYDVLLIDGAVEAVPDALVEQVVDGGRVVTGLAKNGVVRTCRGRVAGGVLGLVTLTDMEMVILPGFERPRQFTF